MKERSLSKIPEKTGGRISIGRSNEDNVPKEVLIYTAPNERVKVEVLLINENIWLTQARIAELFGVERSVVTKHIGNILSEEELLRESTCAKIAHVQREGSRDVKRDIEFYSLDMIVSVGYRVNSRRATMFRIWATERLKEYIIKGYTMDDERLKMPYRPFGQDYFEEQLERIRDIRSSERRFYQKITDIYSQCSADYFADAEITKEFFATVQNKLHYAIHGRTAAEIIVGRADARKNNMGLTTWKNAPDRAIRKTDVSVAKNYLDETELRSLNLIVSAYLDFAELQAKNRNVMYMEDWIKKLNSFLDLADRSVLTGSGRVTAEEARAFAEKEFEKYKIIQNTSYTSDFDRYISDEWRHLIEQKAGPDKNKRDL